jgi:hypothetical protein
LIGAYDRAMHSNRAGGAPAECAAELIETGGLARLAGLSVRGLAAAAMAAAERLNNPHAIMLLGTGDLAESAPCVPSLGRVRT